MKNTKLRKKVEDVAEDRQHEVAECLRRGIIPHQRQRQKKMNK